MKSLPPARSSPTPPAIMHRTLPCALLAAAHLAGQAAPLPVYREFKDWMVACSNSGHCVAKGFEEYTDSTEMLLEQAPGPDGETSLTLSFQVKDKMAIPQLRLNGQALSTDEWEISQEGNAYGSSWIHCLDDEATRKLLATASRKQALTLTDKQGHVLADFKVAGLTASLLLIDETQGRLGTTRALLRTGSKSAATIPPAHPLPVLHPAAIGKPEVSAAEATRLLQAVRKLEPDCATNDDDDGQQGDVAALSFREAIVLLPCGQGAYNTSYVTYRAQRHGKPKPARLVLPGLSKVFTASYEMTNAGYDPASQTLSQYTKGRGVGDCGEASGWIFDGRNFVLSSYSHQGRCGGQSLLDWPALWQTTVEAVKAR
ncbi:DUF1176 domain-containing protein [Chitinimonas arctica]|uniref:DUF1176 domain-containing protein n=1 Tax=Chitinimonas arctica TaxID=2594795 RepID=A0A516SFU2_9NEIS|nr:DUF1176 domain-containing protein [Chitinimonas arctica]QDQ27024.1 DUF1176 domain-containing protein [Chitinimonas arctica]